MENIQGNCRNTQTYKILTFKYFQMNIKNIFKWNTYLNEITKSIEIYFAFKRNKDFAGCTQIVANLHNPFKFEIYYIKSLSELKYILKQRNLFKISGYFR